MLFWGLYTGGNAPKARENFGFYALYKRENRPKFAKILARFQITINPPPLVSPDFGPKGGLIDLNTPDPPLATFGLQTFSKSLC